MSQKLLADSNRASLREIVESNVAWGETPTSGKTRARRFTSSSITVTKDTAVSEEIRDDRMTAGIVETAASSGGEINWEFSAGSQDLDFQRVLMGAWSRPMEFDIFRGAHVAITANNKVVLAGFDYSDYFTIGRRLKTSGFVNPANNDYVEITNVAFTGGNTEITVAGTSLVVEGGTAFTTVQDANDVLIRKLNTLRFGTGGARTIDGNGTNPFSAIIAAGQLVSGQRIFVEGVGYETATVTVTEDIAEADTVTISDGVDTFVFEAQGDSDVTSLDYVQFAVGADETEAATNLAAVINGLRARGEFAMKAVAAAGVVTLTNLNKDGGSAVASNANITVVDFAGGDATFGGFYTVISATNDVITVDRDVPTVVAGKIVTIKGSMLRNPGRSAEITPQSASVETSFNDVGQHFISDGLRSGNISLEVSAGAIITGNTAVMGRETKRSPVQRLSNEANYIPLDAPATEIVSATANVGALSANGEELATALQSIQIQVEGNLRAQQAVGNKFPVGIVAGRLNVTGTITAYFADGTMFDRFLGHETVSLSFPIIDQDKNTYYFTIPAFKITSDPVSPGGTDQDVMESLEFTAIRDAATRCMMQIDRFSSVAPVTAI